EEKMAAEGPTSRSGQAWFCTTGLPSDVIIEVDEMGFHLHKFPLMSKSRKLCQMIEEERERKGLSRRRGAVRFMDPSDSEQENVGEDEEEEECHIVLPDFPGGSDAFEVAAKFCYGVKLALTASTVAAVRCAAEYLEMTEEFSDDNLILKAERFISHSVLRNVKNILRMLSSCQGLLPTAENLGIVQRCIESIAAKVAVADPSLFGWPVNDSAVGGEGSARKELMAGKRGGGSAAVGEWFEEIGRLSLPFFKRLIFALKALNLAGEIIEICLIHYAKKHIPGIFRTSRKRTPSSGGEGLQSENEQREVLETIITNLPTDNSLRSVGNPSRFIFGLLRAAYILNASESSRSTLERKIGSQLEQSTLDDLLIPSYSYLNETLYDVDCVERILTYFLQDIEERFAGGEDEQSSGGGRSAALMLVGKLIDGYLSEIASDANLKPEKFYDLAVSLPDHARHFDDGLYRAVDVYLKAHPWISEAEREKICGVLDYKKLTLEACTHAAQNERLPLRAVVQVLFFEQLQLRHAIAGTLMAGADDDDDDDEGNNNDKAVVPWSYVGGEGEDEDEAARALTVGTRADEGTSAWQDAARENHVLRVDVDSMRTRVHELERECTSMKKAIQKMGPPRHVDGNCWRKKLGCKFRSQVCDSHDQVVGDARKGRAHRRD
ncbi:hypothetical protein M569_02301, partial [Genlisea aurea]